MHERSCHGWIKQRERESETLCRKGGNGRKKVKRSAERVAPVAQTTHPTRAGLAWLLNSLCGATLSATREFVGLVRVLNSLVVAAMITTRELLAS